MRSIALRDGDALPRRFPFTVPAIAGLGEIAFTSPVTFLVGENGCGKSTLLEAIACAVGSIAVGSEQVERDRTLDAVRELGKHLKLTWSARTKRGFYLRAEDFFGYANRLAQLREELQRDLDEVDRTYVNRSRTAQLYARAAYQAELDALQRSYGDGLEVRSHGESFLDLFQARFVPGGLYLLDEPEAPLSPLRQLSFLLLLQEMVAQEAQFLIATHSPIVMAFPGATILSMDGETIDRVAYEDLEHVRITRGFLNHPERYLARLFEEPE
ncbi:MAG: AAA family ATPase [Anaerolineae bacterium]|nr:AAA family ATPase [Anaerolineae bacterium]